MFTVALFLKIPKWNQPRCPSIREWLNKLWYIHITKYYSGMGRNELLTQKSMTL